MRYFWISSVLALSVACAGAPPRAPIGADLAPLATEAAEPQKRPVDVPDDVVARAQSPFRAKRSSDGQILEQAQILDELSRYDVICLGEAHDAARDHYAELAITDGLQRRARISGRALGVGFEMFQAPYAQALYLYGLGHLDDNGLRKRTQYDKRWGYPYAYYRPVLALGRAGGLPLKALNAPSELTRAVAQMGLAALPPRLKRQLPAELNLEDADHRAEFDKLMAGHPKSADGPTDFDNLYAAQVVWDETMADNASRWVAERAPLRQLVILAGSAHCRKQAIPARIERRQPLSVANVRLSAEADDRDGFGYTLLFEN